MLEFYELTLGFCQENAAHKPWDSQLLDNFKQVYLLIESLKTLAV